MANHDDESALLYHDGASRWFRWSVVRPLASRVYDNWARRRYRRLYGGTGQAVSGGRELRHD